MGEEVYVVVPTVPDLSHGDVATTSAGYVMTWWSSLCLDATGLLAVSAGQLTAPAFVLVCL